MLLLQKRVSGRKGKSQMRMRRNSRRRATSLHLASHSVARARLRVARASLLLLLISPVTARARARAKPRLPRRPHPPAARGKVAARWDAGLTSSAGFSARSIQLGCHCGVIVGLWSSLRHQPFRIGSIQNNSEVLAVPSISLASLLLTNSGLQSAYHANIGRI